MTPIATDHAIERYFKRTGRTDFAECIARAVPLTQRIRKDYRVRVQEQMGHVYYFDPETLCAIIVKPTASGLIIKSISGSATRKRKIKGLPKERLR